MQSVSELPLVRAKITGTPLRQEGQGPSARPWFDAPLYAACFSRSELICMKQCIDGFTRPPSMFSSVKRTHEAASIQAASSC